MIIIHTDGDGDGFFHSFDTKQCLEEQDSTSCNVIFGETMRFKIPTIESVDETGSSSVSQLDGCAGEISVLCGG